MGKISGLARVADCFVCGKPFDNELWFLGNAPDGDPELTVFKNRRCPDCWKKLRRDSGCHIYFSEDMEKLKRDFGGSVVT